MSDSDDDESFGPAPPPSIAAIPLQTTEVRPEVPSSNGVGGSQLAAVQHTPVDDSDVATSRSNDVAASPMTSKRARESDELLVTNQGNKERYSLALQSDYDRSFLHNGTIIGVACATWSDGVQLVTLDASGILRWWIKLPMRGYLLAKEVNVAPASVGTASCEGSLFLLQSGCLREPRSAERTALVDLKEGTVRLLHGDLMEIGPRLPLPWSFAATVMPTPDVRPQLLLWHDPKGQGSATTLIAALHNEPKIVAVGLTSRMGSIEEDASSNASRMTAMMSGTMHPIKLMECHCLSGLLVVVDSCGIVDYVHVASSTTSDDVAWRTVRGLDELGKQKGGGSVPSWARHVSFATRTKTSFFAAFRAKHAPIGLSVSDRALLLSCSSGQDVVHYCLDFSSGKLIGTYTQRLSCPTPATVIVPPRWEACPMSHCVSSSSGGVEMEWWCVPSSHGSSLVLFGFPRGCDSKSIGSGTSTDVVTDNFVLAGPPNTAAGEGDGGERMIMMMPLLAHVSTVRPSQQLRNMIARSQLGSGLTADTINGLMGGGGTSSTRSAEMKGEVSLVAACGPHLVFFSSVERGTAAVHRDFTCADISKSLGFNFLQKGDADNEIESLPSASTAAEAAQRVYATITIKGSETTPLQFRLLPFIAPLAVQNFRALAEAGFFRGLTFHRVIKEFMLQGGCPKGDGTGGQCLLPGGGPFRDEFVGAGTTDPLGELDVGGIGSMRTKYLLCMANSGPNTNSSQFFITTAPTPWLAKHHTIFGVLACPPPQEGDCTAMQHLLHTLESVEVDREAKPKRPIVISDVAVTTLSDST